MNHAIRTPEPVSVSSSEAYFNGLCAAMRRLAFDPRTIFLGQAVAYPGTALTRTLEGVPRERLIEMPVAEDMQMGIAIGLALTGYVPISIYPRWNFLLLALNQLVLHLDKLPIYSGGGYQPKVIIRTAVASERPLNPQHQHLGDFTEAVRLLCYTVDVVRLDKAEDIGPAYGRALTRKDGRSTLLVERVECYA